MQRKIFIKKNPIFDYVLKDLSVIFYFFVIFVPFLSTLWLNINPRSVQIAKGN